MPEMNITVRNKIATKTDNMAYVCGNSDYVINFAFDGEWDVYDTKTARFAYGGQHTDVVFTGNQCNVPVITNTYALHVGVFAGDLHTTTAARVPCRKCILCGSGAPADPTPDVYDQLMARMAQLETPDWNQNDPTAKDYVRNRTHWAETGEDVVGTGMSGWSITTSDRPDRVIQKVRIGGQVYENVQPLSYSTELIIGYQIGDYEVTFLKQYDRVSISPSTISPEDIEFIGAKTTYHQIAEEYLPGYTALKTDVAAAKNVANQVVAFWCNYRDSALMFMNIPDAKAIFVSPSGGGTKLSAKRYTHDNKTYYDILSCKTGIAITDAEIPYGTMMLSIVSTGKCYCLNPL